jgi:magnesium transporter
VISGVYGTNFAVLPGQNFVYGFWAMVIFMMLMAIGMIVYFKKKNWF